MQQPRKVTVLLRRPVTIAIKAAILLQAVHPVFQRKWRIGYSKVKPLKHFIVGAFLKVFGRREGVARLDFACRFVVQHEVHLGKTCRSHFLLLAPDRDFKRRFVCCADQQRTGAARRIVNRITLIPFLNPINADHLRKNTRYFGRRIKLSLALAALCRKIAHQILVGVAQNIIAARLVILEIKLWALENGNQTSKLIHHFFACAQLRLIIEMRIVDHAAKVIISGFGKLGDDFVHFLANILISLQRNKIIEAPAFRHRNICILNPFEFVRNILHEQQGKNVILILRSIHAASQFIAASPKGAVQFILLNRHCRYHTFLIISFPDHSVGLPALEQLILSDNCIPNRRQECLNAIHDILKRNFTPSK